ncbi:hypothetical protein B0I35DRAFT_464682 [Stachybotrys elegans]|uniref:Uncharacterized protein n=1 Tax=Stachybotrys elegans TaxID=80388 RepID=A0A8K0SGW6_9HYPO|nr:hypothetical protein B0I35DRAFT_464682 [Stachybotrys elegans]
MTVYKIDTVLSQPDNSTEIKTDNPITICIQNTDLEEPSSENNMSYRRPPSHALPRRVPEPKPQDPRATGLRHIMKTFGKAMKSMVDCEQKYVGAEVLQALKVRVVGLEFETGMAIPENDPIPGSEFIRPMPAANVLQYILPSQPWKVHGEFKPDPDSNFFSGRRFQGMLFRWLDNPPHTAFMLSGTNWRVDPAGPKSPLLERQLYSDHTSWMASYMLRYYKSPGRSAPPDRQWDTSKPHVICMVHDDAPLNPNYISVSELCTVVALALKNGVLTQNSAHAAFPVTVVSCSGKQVRIVQGNINFEQCYVVLRCSRIINIPERPWGVDTNTKQIHVDPDFLCLLGWFLGEAVGNTLRTTH